MRQKGNRHKTKRMVSMQEAIEHLQNTGGFLGNLRADTRPDEPFQDDLLEELPEAAALSLGRPEGSFLSPGQESQMHSVLEAFDNGVLDTLSTMQRNCFTDVIISGDTYQEVAKRYGIARGSVQTHVNAAAKHIRKAIGNLDE